MEEIAAIILLNSSNSYENMSRIKSLALDLHSNFTEKRSITTYFLHKQEKQSDRNNIFR